ncbi:hypothetical protein CcaverHIS002_0210230 [Cutaneotrichosporon cavernicola]|uniref:FIST domain-containing protein n=1 Tax=Cutaneotrichosporon cavernicola TaxID=279322 RepID=A0AA48L2N1_9TREE|nr:uncharacterized protein CcaverHIS019_0210250 [Cutaneotrichosporon cavernicola]BEI81863.1 hypothetical protein CcaverHIS002_0210230 [Cutaneotrichosporon cavernicola]BEI89663.1 hypothetical protein CcaverHIS019_0210250 [Cutaneotrichosporon cavernicola]BEI97434.1 hypothetical protein CcaverHIS631_0210230 [Cutaneotrichosporon cavernicola]BEJ05212.1 hypothetical protein CcaverHIS641_0210290 [Cutaneotrichosporon cavernicola]
MRRAARPVLAPGRRGIRALSVSAHTLEHPTPASLESHLSTLPCNATLLFTLSTSIQSPDVGPLLAALHSFPYSYSLPSSATVGSDSRRNHVVGSFHQSATHTPEVAIAAFAPDVEEGERVRTFYSEATGRAPASVGKWYRTDEPDWPEDERGGKVGELDEVLGSKGWEGVWAARGDDTKIHLGDGVESIVTLTDGTPSPVLRALGAHGAMTTGLVAAATPFLTGRPYTLFYGGQVYGGGSVGVGITRPCNTVIEYGVEPLDAPAKVAGARGNLLLSFDGRNSNPTQCLIAALQARDGKGRSGITKDEEFYLAIMEPGSPTPRVVRILSGDPSRGSISLETEHPLFPGQFVQFMHRPTAPPPPQALADTLHFAVLPRTDELAPAPRTGSPVRREGFVAASEGGFVHGREPSVCTVAGAVLGVSW